MATNTAEYWKESFKRHEELDNKIHSIAYALVRGDPTIHPSFSLDTIEEVKLYPDADTIPVSCKISDGRGEWDHTTVVFPFAWLLLSDTDLNATVGQYNQDLIDKHTIAKANEREKQKQARIKLLKEELAVLEA